MELNDKSSPEAIKDALEMSKKTFKKALGSLYKNKLVTLKDEGVYLNEH
jgi:predicted RNA-binding protein (virulence factor B family)